MKLRQNGFGAVRFLLIFVLIGLLGGVGWYVYQKRPVANKTATTPTITNFEQCKAAGNPIMESYPEQCVADGKTFVNEQQKAAEPKKDESKYLEIKEWEAKIKLDNETEDLYYISDTPSRIYLRLKSLDKLFPKCMSNNFGLQYGRDQDKYSGHIDQTTFEDAFDASPEGRYDMHKKVGERYFITDSPPVAASCLRVDSEKLDNQEKALLLKIKAAAATVE